MAEWTDEETDLRSIEVLKEIYCERLHEEEVEGFERGIAAQQWIEARKAERDLSPPEALVSRLDLLLKSLHALDVRLHLIVESLDAIGVPLKELSKLAAQTVTRLDIAADKSKT